jgi:hypothetical protein
VFYQPHYNNVKYDDTYNKKEDVLRKVFFKECAREDDRKGPMMQATSSISAAGAQIAKPNKNDPQTHLKIIDHILSEFMFIKEPIDRSKPLSSVQSLLIELELDKVHAAHKAFLLALVRSGKVNVENLLRVLAEVRQSGGAIDTECIYCKYSQFALKESNKVGLLAKQQELAQQQQAQAQQALGQNSTDTLPPIANNSPEAKKPDVRIEHMVKMFQSQLFKKSFITTSLLIIQRRMNEKYFMRQRNARETGT